MTTADIFEEYRRIIAIEGCDAKKKHLVDEYQEDEVLVDPEFENYKRSMGIEE